MKSLCSLLLLAVFFVFSSTSIENFSREHKWALSQTQKFLDKSNGIASFRPSNKFSLQTPVTRSSVSIPSSTKVIIDQNKEYIYTVTAPAAGNALRVTWSDPDFTIDLGYSLDASGSVMVVSPTSENATLNVISSCGLIGVTLIYLEVDYQPSTPFAPSIKEVTFNVTSFAQPCQRSAIGADRDTINGWSETGNITAGVPMFYTWTFGAVSGLSITATVSPANVLVSASYSGLAYLLSGTSNTVTVYALRPTNTFAFGLSSATTTPFTLSFTASNYTCITRQVPECPSAALYRNAIIDQNGVDAVQFFYGFGVLFLSKTCAMRTMDELCIAAYPPCENTTNLLRPVCATPYCTALIAECQQPIVGPCEEDLAGDPAFPSTVIPYLGGTDYSTCSYYFYNAGVRSWSGLALVVAMVTSAWSIFL